MPATPNITLEPGTVTMTVHVEPTPDDQARLYAETDARFAAQTGITRKLDPQNKLDAKWIGVWHDLYSKVLAQWRAGTLAYTFDHPSIAQRITDAGKAAGDAMEHLGQMIATKPAGVGMGSLSWAQTPAGQATAAASEATRKAAEAQAQVEAAVKATQLAAARGARHGIAPIPPPPAVVSPDLVHRAAQEVAEDVARGTHWFDRTIGGLADMVAALQGAAAGARADAVNQIATSPPAPTESPPGPGAPVVQHERSQRFSLRELPVGGIAIGITTAAAVGIVAIAAKGGGGRGSARRRARRA
jgi:hypothetical protein